MSFQKIISPNPCWNPRVSSPSPRLDLVALAWLGYCLKNIHLLPPSLVDAVLRSMLLLLPIIDKVHKQSYSKFKWFREWIWNKIFFLSIWNSSHFGLLKFTSSSICSIGWIAYLLNTFKHISTERINKPCIKPEDQKYKYLKLST